MKTLIAILCLCGCLLFAQGGGQVVVGNQSTNGSTVNQITILNSPVQSNSLSQNVGVIQGSIGGSWAGCLHNAANGTRCRIGLIGDSVTQGSGTTLFTNQWTQRMMRALQTQYGYGGTGFQAPYSSTGYWNISAGCTTVNSLGPSQSIGTAFNALYQCTGNSNTATIGGGASGPIYFDTLKIYYATSTDSGSGFTVQIDGVSQGTFGNSTSGSVTAATATIASSAGWHTVIITFPASGNCYLAGIEGTLGSQGVVVDNFGVGGATTTAFGSNTTTQMAFTKYPTAANLFFVSLGVDDFGAGVSPSNYTTQLGNVVSYLQTNFPHASIVLLDEQNVGEAAGGSLTQAQVRATESTLAGSAKVAYLSVAQRWGTYTEANANGLMNADTIHANDAGNRDIAQLVLGFIDDVHHGMLDYFYSDAAGNFVLGNGSSGVGVLPLFQGTQIKDTYVGQFVGGTGGFTSTGSNTGVGYQALNGLTTGHNNAALGTFACGSLSTGSFTTCLGQNANVGAGTGGAVQFNSGTNSTNNSMQFQSWNFLTSAGAATFSSTQTAADTGPFGSSMTTASSACETSYGATTLATGTTTTTTGINCLPANSIIDAVVARVTTTITGSCTGWELGDGTTAARFSSNNTGLTAGTTTSAATIGTFNNTGIASATTGIWQAAAHGIVITCATGNPSAGAIRVIVYYHTWTAPTS